MSLKKLAREFWERVCWHAWNHARRQELKRRKWNPDAVIPPTDETSSPEQRRIVANEARQLLDNRHFQEAFAAVHGYLEQKAHACENKEQAFSVVIAKQLLRDIRREVIRKMEDGYMAEVEIEALEKRKKLTRFVR
jgi:hypothetical protein